MVDHRVVGAVIVQHGRVLLGLRAPTRTVYPNVWDVFGGHIEPGEEPEQTLVRELQEELGITPTHWSYLETLVEPDLVCALYAVVLWHGVPRNQQPEEHTTIAWLSLEEAVQRPLAHPAYPALFAQVLKAGPAWPTDAP